MILLVVFALLMGQLFGTTDPSWKHSNEEQCCSSTKSTSLPTRFFASNPSLKVKVCFLKKIGKFVQPATGFNVIATANTKGKGSDDGRFIGTNVLNEAFLERFPVTFEQEYPTVANEYQDSLTKSAASHLRKLLILLKRLC
jgi:hypothetical protein